MSKLAHSHNFPSDEEGIDEDEYDELELLERLESLREDMEDLGLTLPARNGRGFLVPRDGLPLCHLWQSSRGHLSPSVS